MTVQLIVLLDLTVLLDDLDCVLVHLNVSLKFELETALIFTIDSDGALVFALLSTVIVVVDEAVRD